MKVIEDNSMKYKPVRFTCPGCDSVLEIELDDVKWGEFGAVMGDRGTWYFYVTCAICGKNRLLHTDEADKIPLLTRQRAKGAVRRP